MLSYVISTSFQIPLQIEFAVYVLVVSVSNYVLSTDINKQTLDRSNLPYIIVTVYDNDWNSDLNKRLFLFKRIWDDSGSGRK